MKTYLVGGAVRDHLLNYPVIERDWVVIGETPESMQQQGFRAVGKDFPVFLHPETQEEYALARTERKISAGYKGFSVYASPEVTLEQDLIRRDLTINAIAMDENGQIFDPYQGQKDLKARIFRHVSPAFSEDPVRVLRLARFMARYAHLGFQIADETMQLMRTMVKNAETDALVAERVWAELHKALKERSPHCFFETLRECGALQSIFPEIDVLFGIPQPKKHHPEVDTGIHSLLCLEQATQLSPKAEIRLAALLHDLGKAKSDKNNLPHHYGHEKNGLPVLKKFCTRLRIPKEFQILATQVMEYHTHCHRITELKHSTIVDMLQQLGAFKPKNIIEDFAMTCQADSQGRTGFEQRPYPQANYLINIATVANEVDTSVVINSDLTGAKIGDAIRALRIQAVSEWRQHNPMV